MWERGDLSHGLWLGKERVGVVNLHRDASPAWRYRWEAGTYTGRAGTLKEAKRAVEQAVLLGSRHRPLDPPQRD